jgi:hypothetical protein
VAVERLAEGEGDPPPPEPQAEPEPERAPDPGFDSDHPDRPNDADVE